MLNILGDTDANKLNTTSIKEQDYKEDNLREWTLEHPKEILGEDFLVIGREVEVKNIGDAIDLLAIDRDGNVVIIELKRGSIPKSGDFQVLKYASYVSRWTWEDLSNQFDKFNLERNDRGHSTGEAEESFGEELSNFCNDDYSLNKDQRIVLVGESLPERVAFVSRWLSNRAIDLTVVKVSLFKDGENTLLNSKQVVPMPNPAGVNVSPKTDKSPWKENGREYHLDEKTNEQVGIELEQMAESLAEIEPLEGPHWAQQQYIVFKKEKRNRVIIRTRKTVLHVVLYDIPIEDISTEQTASKLDVSSTQITMSENMSSNGSRTGIKITYKNPRDEKIEELKEFVSGQIS